MARASQPWQYAPGGRWRAVLDGDDELLAVAINVGDATGSDDATVGGDFLTAQPQQHQGRDTLAAKDVAGAALTDRCAVRLRRRPEPSA